MTQLHDIYDDDNFAIFIEFTVDRWCVSCVNRDCFILSMQWFVF